jgi:hypothetical protein
VKTEPFDRDPRPARPPAADRPGTSAEADRDRRIRRLAALADLLDTRFAVPGLGWRFGLDGLIGLIPGVGDTVSTALGAFIVAEAVKLEVPPGKLARMIGNLAVDGVLGSVPVVGDVFDFAFKAHRKNVAIVLDHLGYPRGRFGRAGGP